MESATNRRGRGLWDEAREILDPGSFESQLFKARRGADRRPR